MRGRFFGLILALGFVLTTAARPCVAGDARLAKATEEISFLSFEKARELYQAVMNSSPAGSEDWQAGVYGSAICDQQILPPTDARTKSARDLYHLLLDKSPDSKFAPRATLNLGRIDELSGDPGHENLEAARANYLKVVEKWPSLPIAGEAVLRAASTYVQSYDKTQAEQGAKLIADWLKAHPDNELASVMWEYLGDTYFYPLNDFSKSLDAYEHAEKIGWLDPTGEGKTYWRIAVMSERDLKNRDAAIKYYTFIITRTPTSGKAYEAQQALKRLNAPVPAIPAFKSESSSSGESK